MVWPQDIFSAVGHLIYNKSTTCWTDVQVEIDCKVTICKIHAQQAIPVIQKHQHHILKLYWLPSQRSSCLVDRMIKLGLCLLKSLLSYANENLKVLFHINSPQWIWAAYNTNPWLAMEWFRKPENEYQPMYYITFFFTKQIFRGIWILTKLSEATIPAGEQWCN